MLRHQVPIDASYSIRRWSQVAGMQVEPTRAFVESSSICRARRCRAGLSLLEVMLALAILGVACVFMAQAMQVAASNAIAAERQAQAELAAESVMSEIIAGVIPLQPSTTWTPASSSSNWSYMLQLVTCEVQSMVGIQLLLRDDSDPDLERPADLTVIRWIIDPTLGLDMPPDMTGLGTDAAGQATGGQAGAASGGLNGKF